MHDCRCQTAGQGELQDSNVADNGLRIDVRGSRGDGWSLREWGSAEPSRD